MNCRDTKCIKYYEDHTNEEWELHYVHCSIPGCHDISPDDTSYDCKGCGRWICQRCADTNAEMEEYEGDLHCMKCVIPLLERGIRLRRQKKSAS